METAKDRARRQIVSLLRLAQRPGTAAEGEAAWGRIEALSRKYGFQVRARTGEPNFMTPKRARRSRRVWTAKGAGDAVMREDGIVHATELLTETFQCASCGRTVRRRAEGRRARFCSPACRVRAHRMTRMG